MTATIRPVHYSSGEAFGRSMLRWSLSGLCVLASHGGLAYAALNWPQPATMAADPPAAIMIDLSPLPAAPDTPQQDLALGPQMVMSQAATPSEQEDAPPEPQRPEPEVKPEVTTRSEAPPLPENETAAAVLAQAAPPEPQHDKPKDDKRKPDKPKKLQKKPRDHSARDAPATAAPRSADTRRAATNAAPMAGLSSSVSPATWRSMIIAHLNRLKRAPPGGHRGTSTVAFTIDRSGRVLSARLARSSGNATLDQEVVALAHRASPMPAPPADVGHGGSILLTIPVIFEE